MRLTTKITYNYITPDNVENIDIKCLNKLGKLEDIEEELGVDLIALLNDSHTKHILKSIINEYKEMDR